MAGVLSWGNEFEVFKNLEAYCRHCPVGCSIIKRRKFGIRSCFIISNITGTWIVWFDGEC